MKKNKKKAVKGVLIYLILTVGLWMFLYSYANSYNRLTDEKIVPAALNVEENSGELEIIGKKYKLDFDMLAPESKLYFVAYLFTPSELRRDIMFLCTESAWK